MTDGNAVGDRFETAARVAEADDRSPQSVRRSGRIWVRQASGFTYRTLRDVSRSWTVLAMAIGFPPVMYLLVTATRDLDSVTKGLLAGGIAVLGAMIASLTIFGSQLAVDLEADRFAAYRSMAVYPSADFAGRVAAGLIIAALALCFGLGVSVLDGAPVGVGGVLSVAVSAAGFVILSVVCMAVAVPIVVAANNEQYAQFTLSLVAVFGFMLTGYNGMLMEVAILDGSIARLLPNVLATRAMTAQLVTTEGVAGSGFVPGGRLVPLLAYGVCATAFGVFITRWQLYDEGGNR